MFLLKILSADGNAEIVSKASEMPEFENTENWIKGSDNTYYYKIPVEPDGETDNLLKSKITLIEEDGYQQVVEVFAEAIQSNPINSVEESWSVTLDDNGYITAVN